MFFKKKYRIDKVLYGQRILSRHILTSGQRYFDSINELDIEFSFYHYTFYLQYLLFISGRILNTKYSSFDVSLIIHNAIIGIVDLLDDIDVASKPQLKDTLNETYKNIVDNDEINIFSDDDMHKLTDCFLDNCKYEKIFTNHLHFYLEFTLFIKYHTADILDKRIILL